MQHLGQKYIKKEMLLYKSLNEVRILSSESFNYLLVKAILKLRTLRQICY